MENTIQVPEAFFDEMTKKVEIAKLALKQEQNLTKQKDFKIGELTSENDELKHELNQLKQQLQSANAKTKNYDKWVSINEDLRTQIVQLKSQAHKQLLKEELINTLHTKFEKLNQKHSQTIQDRNTFRDKYFRLALKYNDYL